MEPRSPCHNEPLIPFGMPTLAELGAGMSGGREKGWKRCGAKHCQAVLEPIQEGWRVVIPHADDAYRDEEMVTAWDPPTAGVVYEVWRDDAGRRGIGWRDEGDERAGGYGFGGIPAPEDARIQDEIKVGDHVRVYGQFGSEVAGLDLRVDGEWRNVYFRTEAERHQGWAADCVRMAAQRAAEFESNRDKLDADYAALPEVFQRRIDKYRSNGGNDWRRDYERYEMYCCTEAVKIAAYLRPRYTILLSNEDIAISAATKLWEGSNEDTLQDVFHDPEKQAKLCANIAAKEFFDAPYEEHAGVLDDGHSGNTFSMSVRLAEFYLSGWEEAVIGNYGALAPLVGSEQYSDIPKEHA